MGRIAQLFPGNYASAGNVGAEFENLVRYLLSSERGQKTLGEMLASIFNEDGEFSGAVELRLDSSEGIQYRVGNFATEEEGWESVVPLDELRGEPGANLGTVVLPILTARSDFDGDGTEDEFPYVYSGADRVLVFKDGLLQREGALYDYTLATNKVVFNAAPADGDSITLFKIRGDASISSTRSDQTPVSSQSVFAYAFPDVAYELYIYKNGILQREGGSYDYILNPGTNTITFMSPVLTSDTLSLITVRATGETVVTGLMTEQDFVDASSGLIPWSKLTVGNGGIPQSKVSSLTSDLAARAKLTVSASQPSTPATGQLWLDTSVSPNVLRFFDGVRFNATSPENAIPSFNAANAGQYLRINSTGTGLLIEDIDLSGLITTTQKGAANGVASLDAAGQIPEAQMPEVRATDNLFLSRAGAVSNGSYTLTRTYKQTVRITGISAVLTSGSCQLQIEVAGVNVGAVYSISSTPLDQPLSTLIEIDSTSISKAISVEVSSASSAQDLSVTLAIELLE